VPQKATHLWLLLTLSNAELVVSFTADNLQRQNRDNDVEVNARVSDADGKRSTFAIALDAELS
jgi:hypothetical protein